MPFLFLLPKRKNPKTHIFSGPLFSRMRFQIHIPDFIHIHIQINLGGGYIRMSQHFLYTFQIRTVLHQMGCKGMPQRMWCDILLNPGRRGIGLQHLPESLPLIGFPEQLTKRQSLSLWLKSSSLACSRYSFTAFFAAFPKGITLSFSLASQVMYPSFKFIFSSFSPISSLTRIPVAYKSSSMLYPGHPWLYFPLAGSTTNRLLLQ